MVILFDTNITNNMLDLVCLCHIQVTYESRYNKAGEEPIGHLDIECLSKANM